MSLHDNESKLDELAYELATNYCTVSFGEAEKKQVPLASIFQSGLTTKHGDGKADKPPAVLSDITQHRNILLIGAGATYDGYKCIPLGEHVIKRLNEKYAAKIADFPAIQQKYDSYINDQHIQNRELDFENYLSLFADLILTPEHLRKELAELYTYKYSPSLLYEIIAHMFKHSFIDVIINFNFDELLDRTINEEVGTDNYYHVVSDGDAVSIEDVTVDGRLKIPVYIKPHGTITHKTSLRFTKRHYLDVPESIKDLMRQLISGKRGEIDAEKAVKDLTQVNIISVGFNMASIEFNDILDKFLPARSRIFHFMYGRDDVRDPQFVKKILPEFYKRAFKAWQPERGNEELNLETFDNYLYKRIAIEAMDIDSKENNRFTSPYSELFSCLWRKIYCQFQEHLRPRSIGSHEIIAYLFCDPDFFRDDAPLKKSDAFDRYENNIHYFLDRTLVEIAIIINRNNGVVDIADLLGERAGFYYAEYRRLYIEHNKSLKGMLSIYDLINQFTDDESEEEKKATLLKNIFRLKVLNFDQARKDVDGLSKVESSSRLKHSRLKNWELSFYNNLDDPELIDQTEAGQKRRKTKLNELIDAALQRFEGMLNHNFGEGHEVPITILYHLFRCPLLSEAFTANFKKNYNKKVYNHKSYTGDKDQTFLQPNQRHPLLIDELIRLFLKSSTGHFFTIKPKFNDHANFLTQSFSKSKILHTNLAIEYAFLNMISKDWDVALMIAENGNILNLFQETQNRLPASRQGANIIVINSYEALRQLYLNNELSKVQLIEKRNRHYEQLTRNNTNPSSIHYTTLCLPAIQHNHHMMLFLKRSSGLEMGIQTAPRYIFTNSVNQKIGIEMVGGLYMFRRGFSSTINPILIGANSYFPFSDMELLTNDFRKLLTMFLVNVCRAVAFENDSNPFNGLTNSVDAVNYLNWNSRDTLIQLHRFVGFLIGEDPALDAYN